MTRNYNSNSSYVSIRVRCAMAEHYLQHYLMEKCIWAEKNLAQI